MSRDIVFTEECKEILRLAKKLSLSGHEELSRNLCLKLVKSNAYHDGRDVLKLFYGYQVYNKMLCVEDALNFLLIINCAKFTYDKIFMKQPINYGANAWATRDNTRSNDKLKEVFYWLGTRDRSVLINDTLYFRKLINVMQGSETVSFKVDSFLCDCNLIEIIEGLTSGTIELTNKGELK